MYETVCNEMSGGDAVDLGGQRKKCKSWQAQKEAIRQTERVPVMMDNYNIFIKVARAVGIPQELRPHVNVLVLLWSGRTVLRNFHLLIILKAGISILTAVQMRACIVVLMLIA